VLDYSCPSLERKDLQIQAGCAWLASAIERGERIAEWLDEFDPFEVLVELEGCSRLTPGVLWSLHYQGVDLGALLSRIDGVDEPRLARVEYWDHGRRFDVVDEPGDGVGAMVFAVENQLDQLADLCAWTPGRVPATLLGTAALIGERLFGFRRHVHLRVHETVLDWLRGGCVGVVILDMDLAAPLLHRAAPLRVASVEYGLALEEALTFRPEIFVAIDGG
jgi:hypothetical protein